MRHLIWIMITTGILSIGCSSTESTATIPQPTSTAVFSAQISPDQVSDIAKQGFRSVINNRPDFEEGDSQPISAAIGAAAKAAGLQYLHYPVVSGNITPAEVEAFARHYNTLPKPVLMFCRSGGRANSLYQMAQARNLLK